MTSLTIGDLAQHFMLQRQSASLRSDIANGLAELGSGEVSDVSRHLSGDFTTLAGVERSLTLSRSHASILSSAKTFAVMQGQAFDSARADLTEVGLAFVDAADTANPTKRSAALAKAEASFGDALSALNTISGGRSLFAGAATQSAAFADAEDILTALEASLSGATTASDVMTAADAWFASGGDYDTVAYLGSHEPMAGYQVAEGVVVSPVLHGADPSVRNLLKHHALGALLARGNLALVAGETNNLLRDVGAAMLNEDRHMIDVSARMGALEARIERLETENAAGSFALQAARHDLVGVDPAETTLRLGELETQLRSLYSITARVAGMSLTEYL